jgi:hypothetical protein
MNRLKQYAEEMSKNPRHLPRLAGTISLKSAPTTTTTEAASIEKRTSS